LPAALAVITVLRPGTLGQERDFELRIVGIDEEVPHAAAYIAFASVSELAAIVLTLTKIASAPHPESEVTGNQ
jgi:hypothetical protein